MEQINFDNALKISKETVARWEGISLLTSVTLIRDVFGKISFLLESKKTDIDLEALTALLAGRLQGYFGKQILVTGMGDDFTKEIIEDIETLRLSYSDNDKNDSVKWYVLERPLAKKAWLELNKNIKPAWGYEDVLLNDYPKIITFYSFKGGMGRTTALAGVALCLAMQGKKVVMIDTDVEAPGAGSLFFDYNEIESGVLDYIIEKPLEEKIDMKRYLLKVDDQILTSDMNGEIYLMPASKVNENYLQKLARIDYQDNRPGYLKSIIEELLNDIKNTITDLDYILLDARAGFHDMGGIVTTQLSHGVVLFGSQSNQSWDGLKQVVHALARSQSEPLPVAMVSSMCPGFTKADYHSYHKSFLEQSYNIFLEEYYFQEEPAPAMMADDEPHTPIAIPWDDDLQYNIILYSGNPSDAIEKHRVQGLRSSLTKDPYKSVTERISQWFENE